MSLITKNWRIFLSIFRMILMLKILQLEAVEDFLQMEAGESTNSTVTGPEAVDDKAADEEAADNEVAIREAASGEIFLVDEEAADEAPFPNVPFPSKEPPSVAVVINPPSPGPTLNSSVDEIIMIRSGVDLARVE
jgi:hypothetical protein